VSVSRHGRPAVDYAQPDSIGALFASVGEVDAVISCAGSAVFKPLRQLSDGDFSASLGDKLMGQVRVARAALAGHVRPGGSVTLTSGVLAQRPMPGSAAVSLVNAALEGFARAAALEAESGVRVNVVSPPWVSETVAKLGLKIEGHLPAAQVARAYVASVEGKHQGQVLDPARF
jgi:NAD(P)-dependent dehydrogenase (short-subunit alcohol dehydrogenase family)